MTDTTATPEPAGSADANGEQQQGSTGSADTGAVDHAAEAEKWKALARKHEQEAKANREKAAKFDEVERSRMTDDEKRAAREKELETEASTAKAELAKVRAAIEAGLDVKFADRLKGSTPEELLADAKSLIEVVGSKTDSAPPPAKFDGGPQGDAPPAAPKDGNDWLRQTVEQRKAQGSMTLKL